MYNWMGFFKYGLACLAAAIPVVPAIIWKQYASILLAIPLFYAVEVQMVFLFPVALDGSCSPFRDSLEWTARAGGTIAAMRIVMLLAVVMLFGGLAGRGFVRSWCIGCAAVCIWYERLRNSAGGNQAGSLAGTDAA
jgi:hypothetical protein